MGLTWKDIKSKNNLSNAQIKCIKLAYKKFLKSRISINTVKQIVYNNGKALKTLYNKSLKGTTCKRGGFISAIIAAIASAIAAAASAAAPVVIAAAPIIAGAALSAGTEALILHVTKN